MQKIRCKTRKFKDSNILCWKANFCKSGIILHFPFVLKSSVFTKSDVSAKSGISSAIQDIQKLYFFA